MITMTSDFGLKDPYVAEMKAVILTISPKAIIVDITHEIENFNIRAGAFILASAAPFFPNGTVHLVVVDPGVGTSRRAILLQTAKALFVGPDNGVLVLAARNQGIEHAYQLANPKFMLPKVSTTFNGRDVFAPAAANLDKGAMPEEFGPEVKNFVTPSFAQVSQFDCSFFGEILNIDRFGNIITNLSEKETHGYEGKVIRVQFAKSSVKLSFGKTYSEVKPGEPIALVGSQGFLEIALNQDDAAEKYQAKIGEKITITIA